MVKDTIHAGLSEIKEFIVAEIEQYDPSSLPGDLDAFLQRLIEPWEGDIEKGEIELKAGRQLLCSIGIDIRHGIVPPVHYRRIFQSIRLDEMDREARKLFRAAVLDHDLFYRKAEEKQLKEFCMIVFPMKDLHYYWNGNGVSGRNEASHVQWKSWREYQESQHLELTCQEFNKNKDGPESRYFWVTTRKHIDEMVTSVEPRKATTQVIDMMGLSHFDVEMEGQKEYFFVDLGETEFTTFKPNATLVDWDSPLTGFLSCWKKQPEGHTFSITGYKNFKEGIAERVFLKVQLSEEQKRQACIKFFGSSVIPPIPIEAADLIKEGITRFKA
jgi:hypothetical protein